MTETGAEKENELNNAWKPDIKTLKNSLLVLLRNRAEGETHTMLLR